MRVQRRKISLTSVLVVIFVLIIGGYLISPLFFDREVDEEFPTSAPTPTTAANTPTADLEATAAMEAAMTAEPVLVEDPMTDAMANATILLQGEFYDVVHEGSGTATIYLLADGSRILRFENFEVLNGPDLHVWFTSDDPVSSAIGVLLPDYFDLGPLKGNIGDQNYDIPTDLDISIYRSVVVWCVPFLVPFIAAPLIAP